MSKTLKMLAIALTMGGIAAMALPNASALACASHSEPPNFLITYEGQTCNYVVGGGAAREATQTVVFLEGEAVEIAQYVWDTYGDNLP